MRKHLFVAASILLLFGCGQKPADPAQTAFVVGSGPYHVGRMKDPSFVRRNLMGEDKAAPQIIFAATGWVFANRNNPDEEFKMFFPAPRISWAIPPTHDQLVNMLKPGYLGQRISPGIYDLKKVYIGGDGNHWNHDYDSAKCGVVSLTIKPNEVVYVGGLTAPDDFLEMEYSSFLPRFKDEGAPTENAQLFEHFNKEEKDFIKSRHWVTRLPNHEKSQSSDACEEKSKPLMNKF